MKYNTGCKLRVEVPGSYRTAQGEKLQAELEKKFPGISIQLTSNPKATRPSILGATVPPEPVDGKPTTRGLSARTAARYSFGVQLNCWTISKPDLGASLSYRI
jgi:hypothetical protein